MVQKKLFTVFLILALSALIIAGCTPQTSVGPKDVADGGSDGEVVDGSDVQEEEEPKYEGPAQLVVVTISSGKIKLDKNTINAGNVKFIITNEDTKPHAIRIGNKQHSVNTDEVEKIETALDPGTYDIICPLEGHAEEGEKVVLTVK